MGIRPLVTLHHFSNPVWVADPRDPTCTRRPDRHEPVRARLAGRRDGHRRDGASTRRCRAAVRRPRRRVGHASTSRSTTCSRRTASATSRPAGSRSAHSPTSSSPVRARLHRRARGDVPRDQGERHRSTPTATASPPRSACRSRSPTGSRRATTCRRPTPTTSPRAIASSTCSTTCSSTRSLNGTFDTDLDGTPDEQHPEWAGTLDWLGLQYYFRAGVTGAIAR